MVKRAAGVGAETGIELVTGDQVKVARRLRVGSCGGPRSGKTHFAFTAPKKIGLIPLDANSIPTFKKLEDDLGMEGMVYYPKRELFGEREIRAVMKPLRLSAVDRQNNQGKATAESAKLEQEIISFYRSLVDRITDLAMTYYEMEDVETVVVDTGLQLYDFMQFAHFGRLANVQQRNRGPINQEMRDFINACPKHLVMIHPMKEDYRDDKPTGRMVIDGWKHLSVNMNVCIEHFKIDDRYSKRQWVEEWKRNDTEYDDDEMGEYPVFGMIVYDSQTNPLLGRDRSVLLGTRCNFPCLAAEVFGGDPSDWMED